MASEAGLSIKAERVKDDESILTAQALEFAAGLERSFGPQRAQLLAARRERQAQLDAGGQLDFLPETRAVRDGDWTVGPIPADLQDRRVEITGPPDRKMVINALNSGACAFMADFEDASSPQWSNMIAGQINLRDAVDRTIAHSDERSGKQYALGPDPAVLMVRPRGWHLDEAHVHLDGKPVSGSLFDFGLYFFHNASKLAAGGSGPYFYLPKLEHHEEARLWNDVFCAAQSELGLPAGTIKATVLIETITAAFQMDEILHELKEHSVGLNCGRWDYIFSYIKAFARRPECVLPDRSEVGMTQPMMRAYSRLAIKTCHRRGAHAMGGMAAQIPIKGDPAANEEATAKVRADKEREARDGHDGTWVAHPAQVAVAKEIFDRFMPSANQIGRKLDDLEVSAEELLELPAGSRTEAGLRSCIRVGIQYIDAWLQGQGAVPLNNLMEDAATAEICRTQIWQWLHHRASLDDGRAITPELFEDLFAAETKDIKAAIGADADRSASLAQAIGLFRDLCLADECADFLTLLAYRLLTKT